jgi:hypothetical protein
MNEVPLHSDPWTKTLVDLSELNREASGIIEQGVGAIRNQARLEGAVARTASLVLLGPPGTGKTHLFARVRQRLGPRAVFVHMRPLLHAGLTPGYVLSEAVRQLAERSYGRQELQADALVGSLIGHLEGQGADFPVAHLSAFRELDEKTRTERLDAFAERLFESFPDLDVDFVERMLKVPFEAPRMRRALLGWLSGQDCDPSHLSRIGAAAAMDPKNAGRALRTLGMLAALGAPLVLVFDQLENLVQRDAAEERITEYGNLVAELVDSTRGILVVQMALDSEWEQGIAPRLNLSQRSRVEMKKASVALPTPKQSRALLELWAAQLEEPEHPFPWPLSPDDVNQLTALPGVTPRMLLSALMEAREGQRPSILASDAPALGAQTGILADEWHKRLVAAHAQIDEAEARRSGLDAERLCDGILLAAGFSEGVGLTRSRDTYIQMDPKHPTGRWLSVLHQPHFKSIGSALDRALARDANRPGLVVREQWRPFPSAWKATNEKLTEFMSRNHLAWHWLERQEAASLLALEEILQLARSRDLCDARGVPVTEAEVFDYLRTEVHPERWALLVALGSERKGLVAERGLEANPGSQTSGTALGAATAPPSKVQGPSRTVTDASDIAVSLRGVLLRLRIASVDRVIREAQRLHPNLGRTAVMTALEGMGEGVRWFGRNIVACGGDL